MQNCTLSGDKCKSQNAGTNFCQEKCRISTIATATKTEVFARIKQPNHRIIWICKGILGEIDKTKMGFKKEFVQKASVAVFPVKIAKKC